MKAHVVIEATTEEVGEATTVLEELVDFLGMRTICIERIELRVTPAVEKPIVEPKPEIPPEEAKPEEGEKGAEEKSPKLE